MLPEQYDIPIKRSLALVLMLLLSGTAGLAQDSPAPPAEDPTTAVALAKRAEETRAEIEALRAGPPASAADPAYLEQRTERLTAIESTLKRSIDQRRVLDAPPEPAQPETARAPSISALIALLEELQNNRRRVRDLTNAAKADTAATDAAEAALQEAERLRRVARDAHKELPTPEASAQLVIARLDSRLAQERVHLRELERRRDRGALERAKRRTPELQLQIASLEERIRSEPTGPDEPNTELLSKEGEVSRLRETEQRSLASLELQLSNATNRYKAQSDPSPALLARVETLRLLRDAKSEKVAALDAQLARIDAERELRERWSRLIRDSPPNAETHTWAEELERSRADRQRASVQNKGRISELEQRLRDLETRLEDAELDPELRKEIRERRETLQHLRDFLSDDTTAIDRQAALEGQLLESLHEASGSVPLSQRLSSAAGAARDLWNSEITTVDDEAITVGNALLALVLISLGFTISRRASHGLRQLIESRLQLEPGIAGAIQTAVFYVLLISFGLIALRTINFPLTAFTVAGGALAIGIGFGSQNVMNNFISGLILMLERPIRSQDLVEVESTHGTVEHIGARSTRIRASDGRHIIVPNSFFLENNVVNWTLSDDLIRGKVSVGVIYGSPTLLVKKLIQQALDENRKILATPSPIIIFNEFGDNSLNFDAHFWMRARAPMQVSQVASELRFRIDDLFREHDLVIAFPQRDVHIDSVSPIEVKFVRDEDPSDERAQSETAEEPEDEVR